ncbi:hypothetical protein KIM372_00330 [Bombiscardovia nodaiensis]|uniref:Uncharacterized protein n=1 Tax=Bombiscardovia nodaiensis TaxID=2932181 RepID=A0ABN6SAG9_9BIFI|nr:hypothetical protein KIM372_00330 [Bombiscardovia nodaiensis]
MMMTQTMIEPYLRAHRHDVLSYKVLIRAGADPDEIRRLTGLPEGVDVAGLYAHGDFLLRVWLGLYGG